MKKVLSSVAAATMFVAFYTYSIDISFSAETTDTYQAAIQENNEGTSSAYISKASDCFMKRDLKSAEKYLTQGIENNPNNPLLYLNRGYLRHVLEDTSGAMNDYDTALKINPNFIYAYNNRGVLKASINDVKGAMEDYAKALSINANYADIYYNRGNLKYMLSDNQGALADYDKAIQLNPKDSDAYNNRGVVKKRLDFNVGALSDYSQAIALNPKDSIAYANRGKLKKLYFDNEGAAIDLNQAIALAENQTFIKNVKPLLSNDRYIAAIPVVNGVTQDNPSMVKVEPSPKEKLAEKPVPKMDIKESNVVSSIKKDGTKLALSTTGSTLHNIKPTVSKTQKTQNETKSKIDDSSKVISAGIGTVKAIEPPDIRTNIITQTPTTNIKLAESYYIRGLQKCVLRDLKGAIADLDKAIANNNSYADAYFYRAAIRKELGDTEGFRSDYSKAIQINPALQAFNDSNAIGLIRG